MLFRDAISCLQGTNSIVAARQYNEREKDARNSLENDVRKIYSIAISYATTVAIFFVDQTPRSSRLAAPYTRG